MGKNRDLVDRFWQLLEDKKLEQMSEICAADVEFSAPGGVALRGVGQLRPFVAAWLNAFPDMKHEVLTSAEDGDAIAVELRIRATHTAPLQSPKGDIPATNRKVQWDSCDFIRIEDGKVVSWHAYWDQVTFLTQLGLLPPG
jgi:steroid delta-isomerase-like uncharacterized protein